MLRKVKYFKISFAINALLSAFLEVNLSFVYG